MKAENKGCLLILFKRLKQVAMPDTEKRDG
jgi:hypothetical protein